MTCRNRRSHCQRVAGLGDERALPDREPHRGRPMRITAIASP
ncbi:hypothetical protein [Lysobacter gummosus]